MTEQRFFYSTPYHVHSSKKRNSSQNELVSDNETKLFSNAASSLKANAIDIKQLFHSRKGIAHLIKFYAGRLRTMDPAGFIYLNDYQRIALEEELLNTAYLLYDECHLHALEGETKLFKERTTQLNRCGYLLNRLRQSNTLSKETSLQLEIDSSDEKPVKYVALTLIAPLIAQTMHNLSISEGMDELSKLMSAANMHRLNWLWGGGLASNLIGLMPMGIGHRQYTQNVFSRIQPVTGYMSWVLYYLYFGIELYLLAKGTLKGSWMDPWQTPEDKALDLGIYERFTTQLNIRQYNLLNYSFWGTANLACFFWLIGTKILGYLGNVLNGFLFLFDLVLVSANFLQKETEHHQFMAGYREEINQLTGLIVDEKDETQINVLEEHLRVLFEAKNQTEFEWAVESKKNRQDILFALALLTSFALICCFFFPPAMLIPLSIMVMSLLGALSSVIVTMIYHGYSIQIEIDKLQTLSTKIADNMTDIEDIHGKLATKFNAESDENQKKILRHQLNELELKQKHTLNDLTYHQDMIAYLKVERVTRILSNAMIPASSFAFLMFLPIGIGFPVLIPVVILSMMSVEVLKYYKPQIPEITDDDENVITSSMGLS